MKHRKGFRLHFPRLQGRLVGLLAISSLTAVVLCTCLSAIAMAYISGEMPNDGQIILQKLPQLMGILFLCSFALCLPAFVLIGAFGSMPLFGALFRINGYLTDIQEGSETKPLKLRDNDPFQELAAMVNTVSEPMREQNEAATQADKAA